MDSSKEHSRFCKEELERYSRHLLIPEFNISGQQKLKSAQVLVIGAGGLGSPVLLYLAAAGVGTLGIVDFDLVDRSNLQRQVLYSMSTIGERKTTSAKQRLLSLNPHIKIILHDVHLKSENALEILDNYDIIVDGTDNFPTRYLINDACVILRKPLVYGSIFQFEGQVSVFNLLKDGLRGPNYRDLFPTPPAPGVVPSCAEGGVLGVLPGIIGTLQANEVIKIATGLGDTLTGRLYIFDALAFTSVTLKVKKASPEIEIKELIDYEEFCGLKTYEETFDGPEITPEELASWKEQHRDFQLIDIRKSMEYDIVNLGGLLIPLDGLPANHAKISRTKPVVLYCRSGARSAQAQQLLIQEFGFDNVFNLKGGILAYADTVDQTLPKY